MDIWEGDTFNVSMWKESADSRYILFQKGKYFRWVTFDVKHLNNVGAPLMLTNVIRTSHEDVIAEMKQEFPDEFEKDLGEFTSLEKAKSTLFTYLALLGET